MRNINFFRLFEWLKAFKYYMFEKFEIEEIVIIFGVSHSVFTDNFKELK